MKEFEAFFSIPQYIQIVLVTGYIGFRIARSGLREHERKDELLYGILVYGLFGYIIYDLCIPFYKHLLIPAFAATATTTLLAIFWRKYGSKFWSDAMHKLEVSNEDGTPNVWAGLTQCTTAGPTQVEVLLKNGTSLACQDVQSFSDAPFPKYYTDSFGNIAIYVTHKQKLNSEKKEQKTVRDAEWGDRITYIPAQEIERILFRFKHKAKKD
jgi:hypothetical protein